MITLRKDHDRRHIRSHEQEFWLSFSPQNDTGPLAEGFGALETLNEDRLPPGAGLTLRPRHDAEIVTYLREGTLSHEDSKGRSGVLQAGDFRRLSAGRGLRHSDTNASRTDWAHVFQIWLYPSERDDEQGPEVKRVCAADRQGTLCLIASPDGRGDSLRVRQDALIYSAILAPGQHLAHALPPDRSAWLHLVQGKATLGHLAMSTGDGAGVSANHAVSLGAIEETEILLLELPALPLLRAHDGPPRGPAPLDNSRAVVTASPRRGGKGVRLS